MHELLSRTVQNDEGSMVIPLQRAEEAAAKRKSHSRDLEMERNAPPCKG